MYKYSSLFKNNDADQKQYSSDELYIDGVALTDLVDGYKQLSVTGRGLFNTSYEVQTMDGMSPNIVKHEKMDPLEIKIKYSLKSKTISEHIKKITTLNSFFDGLGICNISFKDDRNFYMRGYYNGADETEMNSLNTSGTFSLLIPNRRKFSGEIDTMPDTPLDNFHEGSTLLLSRIRLTLSTAVPTLKIGEKSYTVGRDGVTKPGDVIELEWDNVANKFYLYINGKNDYRPLSIFEDIENANVVKPGSIVSANGASVTMRRYLSTYRV